MMTTEELCELKTDAERLAALNEVSCFDWGIVATWEAEAKDQKYKAIFKNRVTRLIHEEEYRNSDDVCFLYQ